MKHRPRLNLVIDALMLLCMASIVGIGVFIKHVMPPGHEHVARFGRHLELTWLGMDRHGWGTVHLAIGLVLLALLAAHIVLHWSIVTNIYRRLVRTKVLRWAIAIVFACVCLLLIILPLFIQPEKGELGSGRGAGRGIGEGRGARHGPRVSGQPTPE